MLCISPVPVVFSNGLHSQSFLGCEPVPFPIVFSFSRVHYRTKATRWQCCLDPVPFHRIRQHPECYEPRALSLSGRPGTRLVWACSRAPPGLAFTTPRAGTSSDGRPCSRIPSSFRYFVAALYMITLLPVVCSVMLSISYKNCFKHGPWLTLNSPLDLWCIRILVHNGLATYVTWTFFVSLINFGMVLKYDGRVGDDYITPIVLYLALFGLLFWFLLETFVLEEFVRYTITIYPVVTVALFGIFLQKGMPTGRLSETDLVIVVAMAVSIVACFLRVILLFLCDNLRPLFQVENYTSFNRAPRVSGHSFTGEISEQTSHADTEIRTDDDI